MSEVAGNAEVIFGTGNVANLVLPGFSGRKSELQVAFRQAGED